MFDVLSVYQLRCRPQQCDLKAFEKVEVKKRLDLDSIDSSENEHTETAPTPENSRHFETL